MKEEFENRLEALIRASNTLNESLVAHITQARFQRNILVPAIHTLPYEILTRILALSMDTRSGRSQNPRQPLLLRTSAVCRFWKQVIFRTPSLWSVITSADRQEFVKLALIASRSTPLDINYNLGHHSNGWSDRQFVDLIRPHIHRFRSLTLDITVAGSWRDILSTDKPRLEDIHILTRGPSIHVTPSPLSRTAPKLRRVHIDGFIVPLGDMTELRSLVYKNAPLHPLPLADIITILRSSPALEELILEQDTPPTRSTDIPPPADIPMDHSPIYLPDLKELNLRGYPEKVVAHLLECIKMPSCDSVRLGSTSDLPASPLQVVRTLVEPVAAMKGHLSIQFSQTFARTYWSADRGTSVHRGMLEDDGILTQDSAYDIAVELDYASVYKIHEAIADDLLPILEDVQISMIMKSCPGLIVNFESWRDLALPVEELSLEPDGGLQAIVQYMSKLDENRQWPFPNLVKLTIRGDWVQYQQDIEEMIWNRYVQQTQDVLPQRLENLTIHRQAWSASFGAALEGVIGMDRIKVIEDWYYIV